MLDQSYINLFILVIIVAIVMFLWRKLIILEGNFFVLEKRVNLIKKDAREDSIAKNIDKADIIMNEIFKDYAPHAPHAPLTPLTPSNACKQSVCGSGVSKAGGGSGDADEPDDDADICYPQEGGAYNIPIGESRSGVDPDVITFVNGGNIEIDLGDAAAISSGEEYEKAMRVELIGDASAATAATAATATDDIVMDALVDTLVNAADAADTGDAADAADAGDDTMSICSEITFTTDDKALKKKYVKMSLDKLKDVCGSLNINGEGTRNELINRIITVKK